MLSTPFSVSCLVFEKEELRVIILTMTSNWKILVGFDFIE